MTQKAGGKGNEIMRALTDFLILVVLLVGTGFGGYYLGIHEQLAPLSKVPPGTLGAIPNPFAPKTAPSTKTSTSTATSTAPSAPASTPVTGKRKFWISSAGTDQIGQQIIVKINDTPVDSFFGPGKLMDITDKVKRGDNRVVFECKSLGEQYNTHKGESDATLTVQVNAGPKIEQDSKASQILASHKRTATDSEDATESMHFSGE